MGKGSKKKKALKATKESQVSGTPEKDNRGNEETEKKDKKPQHAARKFIPRLDDPHKIRKPCVNEKLSDVQKTFYCRECRIRFSNNVKPMTMKCGHSICDMCIEDLMGKSYQCKKCNYTNEISSGKFKVNYLLINVMDDVMDDVYWRVKVFDTFNARGLKTPRDAEEETYVDPLQVVRFKAERKVVELEGCNKVLTEDSITTDKAQKKIINASEASLSTLKENMQSVDLTSIIKAVTDLHYSIKPVDMKLSECRQSMGRICNLDESRRKFLRRFHETGVELPFNQRIVKELHESGYKMVVAIQKKIHSLWARLEYHDFGYHMSCFNATKPEEATFYFEYKDILNSECEGVSHVWLDIAAPTPKGLKDKSPYNLCSFDLENARQSKDSILVEEEVPLPQEAVTEAATDASSTDPKVVADPIPELQTKIVKKLVQSLRQRVYINLAETCHASHFAEFALGKDKVSYKDWNLKLEKPSVVAVGTDGYPSSLSCRFTSIHPSQHLTREERGHVYACSTGMKSGAFKINLGSSNAESSLIGTVHSGIDFLDKIGSYANIKDCGVVLKFKK